MHQPVGVVVLQRSVSKGHFVTRRSGEFTQHRIAVRHIHQGSQVVGAGLVFAGQSGRLHITGIGHSQQARLDVHLCNKDLHAAWVGAAQCMGGAVLAGHQCQMQHLLARECGPHRQARTTAFFSVHVVLRDGDHLIHGQPRLADDEARHQLGQGRNGQHGMIVLAQ